MKWEKLGLIYNVNGEEEWCISHASNPYPEWMGEGRFRIYFSTRDNNKRSSIASIEYDIDKMDVIPGSLRKLLEPGHPGAFDDCGLGMGCVIKNEKGIRYLYYMGWHLELNVPWSNYIGLALEDVDGNWHRYSSTPIIDRSDKLPYSVSFPNIIKDDGKYAVWLGTNVSGWGTGAEGNGDAAKWEIVGGTSWDGIHFDISSKSSIKGISEYEHAFAAPCVIKENEIYKMWYSYRGNAYHIGYAESKDGENWARKDGIVGIEVSESGWDSEMIEYPAVFDHKGERYMLYCGNDYGKTGFGIARLIQG